MRKVARQDLRGAHLHEATLSQADMSKALLQHVDGQAALLYKTRLEGSHLIHVGFRQAQLYQLDLSTTTVQDVDARGAILDAQTYDHLKQREGVDLEQARVVSTPSFNV